MQLQPEENTTELEVEVDNTQNNEVVDTNEPEVEPNAQDNQPEVEPETVPNAESNEPEVEPENEPTTEPEAEAMYTEEGILARFENICNTVDELVEMAKEGLEHRNVVISEALDSGVHSMGNSFDKDIFTKTFSNMKTKDIEKMGKAWEEQANAQFVKNKVSKQDFSNEKETTSMKVDMKQFKTGIY